VSPFDLRGPAFLLYYAILSAVVLGLLALVRRVIESGPVPRLRDVDPYLIAHLRGGPNEAMRVAALSLLDRGLLQADGEKLEAEKGASTRVRRSLERAILAEFKKARDASDMFHASGTKAAARALQEELEKQRLVAGAGHTVIRVALGAGALAILWGTALHKIQLALSRGHSNILLLILLALIAAYATRRVLRGRMTTIGQRLLQDLQTLFAGLRDRATQIQPGGATNELALLAAIFGLSALTGPTYTQAKELFPAATASSSGASSSSCGSACGSASSCGGGGSSCGGGCGGCGGGCGG
jgi:uncharacterized protein (TIGR04222 family)